MGSFFFFRISDTAASQAGIAAGSCVLKVGEKDAVKMRHDEVVTEVKKLLEETAKAEGERRVSLKLSLPHMEQLAVYQYDSLQNCSMEVYERTVESPYVFSVPAKVWGEPVYVLLWSLSGKGSPLSIC